MTGTTWVCDDSHDEQLPMTNCCPHGEDEHHLVTVCQEVIHYPSEDYPCVCTSSAAEEGACADCGHAGRSHVARRICRPADGDMCGCTR
jgi:hypothetical protein